MSHNLLKASTQTILTLIYSSITLIITLLGFISLKSPTVSLTSKYFLVLQSDRIDGVSTKIGLRKKQPTVLLNVPVEELPAEYVRVTHKPDSIEIGQLLKANARGAIDWASLSESHEHSVTIR